MHLVELYSRGKERAAGRRKRKANKKKRAYMVNGRTYPVLTQRALFFFASSGIAPIARSSSSLFLQSDAILFFPHPLTAILLSLL